MGDGATAQWARAVFSGDYARQWAPVFAGLLRLRGRACLSVSQVKALGQSFQGRIAVAVRQGRAVLARKYYSMHWLRSFIAFCEEVLQSREFPHDAEVFSWFWQRQSKKYREQQRTMLRYFEAFSWEGMQRALRRMRGGRGAGGRITVFTMQVNFCETRQAVNRYGLSGLCFLLQEYRRCKALRVSVSGTRVWLRRGGQVSRAHTIVMLDAVVKYLGLSLAEVRGRRPDRLCGAGEVAHQIGRLRICPKVELQGIPEWNVFFRCGIILLAKQQHEDGVTKYNDLMRALQALGVSKNQRNGRRKSRQVLGREFARAVGSATDTGMRKRSAEDLFQDVQEAGGKPLCYVSSGGQRKRRRMKRAAMEAFLRASQGP